MRVTRLRALLVAAPATLGLAAVATADHVPGGGVARSRRKGYRFRNCEKVDYRPESVRGGPLKPLS